MSKRQGQYGRRGRHDMPNTLDAFEAAPIEWRRRRFFFGRVILGAVAISVLLFLSLPILVVMPMSFSSASTLQFPPPGLSLRWYAAFFTDRRWMDDLWTSLEVALAASTLALLLGGSAAYGLVRGRFAGRLVVEANFILPIVIPSVITALALYLVFARIGLLGTLPALIIGHMVLGVPVVVLVMTVAFRGFDVRLEQVAFTLGASPRVMLLRVLLPNVLPSIGAAWIFAFITSVDEVIVTIFISGTYETIPKRMFNELVLQIDPTITAIASLLTGISILLLVISALLMRSGERAKSGYD
ncbi:MAG: ABC transporter permease [Mesorhizobium sp.]|nr:MULTISPECIES: ABC transporter permease [unclassified Mesorhizobium]RUW31986.1 ABC transporter permease [Mesorhizobium sp. M2A.F.Ca.ET.015.02.1.1]RVC92205.1 ABC transporter permease [Mesorhizobium sp. M2A.F.Ca.ET.029.05.1.1]RWC83369.1 MAG: ABC transporter permease [Mesorhizobium sp.]RWF55695.1 MAG: ABC transporter permease [Mesorhizobium sp.]